MFVVNAIRINECSELWSSLHATKKFHFLHTLILSYQPHALNWTSVTKKGSSSGKNSTTIWILNSSIIFHWTRASPSFFSRNMSERIWSFRFSASFVVELRPLSSSVWINFPVHADYTPTLKKRLTILSFPTKSSVDNETRMLWMIQFEIMSQVSYFKHVFHFICLHDNAVLLPMFKFSEEW